MDRLLSPNEAKFWLMDWAAPMNSVVVTRTAARLDPDALSRGSRFTLPLASLGKNQRPRWTRSDAPGVVEEERDDDPMAWLASAERLLEQRVGTDGHPLWRAVVVQQSAGSTLVLAVNHALTDWRTGQWVADHMLAGAWPGEVAPACEELLPVSLFGDPEAEDLIEEWWGSRAGARWEAVGLDRLAGFLTPPLPTRLACHRLARAETAALQARCEAEGATLNGAVAVALRDTAGASTVAHTVDMSRFVKPALPPGPGMAISHVFVPNAEGAFWNAAREVRAGVFAQIQAGAAGDGMLIFPRALLREGASFKPAPATFTITGFPTYRRSGAAGPAHPMQLVVSSARSDGDIVLLSHAEDCLQLIACSQADRSRIDLAAIAARLRRAAEEG